MKDLKTGSKVKRILMVYQASAIRFSYKSFLLLKILLFFLFRIRRKAPLERGLCHFF